MTADPKVSALVLTGAGRGFCSGQNLKAFQALGDDIVAGVMRHYWPTFEALRACRVPIIVAVNGVAAGGGFSLAMSGDIIVAARSASFIQVFSRIALVPDLDSNLAVAAPDRPPARAGADAFQRTAVGGAGAKEWGLVREVFDDERLLDGAMQLAQRLAEGPTRTLVATRRLIEDSEDAATPSNSAARSRRRRRSASAPTRWRVATPSSRSVRRDVHRTLRRITQHEDRQCRRPHRGNADSGRRQAHLRRGRRQPERPDRSAAQARGDRLGSRSA